MRFKGFMIQRIGDDRPEFREFKPEHYKRAGIAPQAAGMPVLEAYQLVNEFNKGGQRAIHWLEQSA